MSSKQWPQRQRSKVIDIQESESETSFFLFFSLNKGKKRKLFNYVCRLFLYLLFFFVFILFYFILFCLLTSNDVLFVVLFSHSLLSSFLLFSIAHDLDVSLFPSLPKGETNFLRRLVWIDGCIYFVECQKYFVNGTPSPCLFWRWTQTSKPATFGTSTNRMAPFLVRWQMQRMKGHVLVYPAMQYGDANYRSPLTITFHRLGEMSICLPRKKKKKLF